MCACTSPRHREQILPLRVVAKKGAAAGRNSASSTEDLKIRGTRLLFDRQVLQAELDQRPRRRGKVGCCAAEADIAAEIKAAPAREGCRRSPRAPAAGCRAGSEDHNRRRARAMPSPTSSIIPLAQLIAPSFILFMQSVRPRAAAPELAAARQRRLRHVLRSRHVFSLTLTLNCVC